MSIKKRKVKQIITYTWWNVDKNKEINESYISELDESAENKIAYMRLNGYIEGELFEEIENEEYRGYWSLTTKVI